MRLETIDMGVEMNGRDRARVERSLSAFLGEHADRLRLVRVRLFRSGRRGMVRCKIRAWHGDGPTVVVTSVRPTVDEAVVEAAESLGRAIGRRQAHASGFALRRRVQRAARRLRSKTGGAA